MQKNSLQRQVGRQIEDEESRCLAQTVIEQRGVPFQVLTPQAFEERHYPVPYWSRRWGFSEKTVRDWFRDEYGPGVLPQPNTGRRSKRDYTTMMISPSAAARVYAKRTGELGLRTREVM